jgi:small subunit ribosomal protein S1
MNNEETQNDFEIQNEISSENNVSQSNDQNGNDVASNNLPVTENQITESAPIQTDENKPVFSFVDEPLEKAVPETEPTTQVAETQEVTEIPGEIIQSTEEIPLVDENPQTEAPNIAETSTDTVQEDTKTSEQETTSEENKKSEMEIQKSARQKYFDQIYEELRIKKNKRETIEVEVKARVRGGLRVHYKDIPLFLPTSHYTFKRNPTEEELQNAVGEKFNVYIHEIQEFDEGKKAAIVSRKKILVQEAWEKLQVGDIVEGRVATVLQFGVLVDFNGLEGLIHISQLSKAHIDVPSKYYKKGQEIKARVLEIVREKKKISLSSKEFEGSLWKGVDEEFKPGTQVKGIVRRITEFGAYVEIKPGVDGLLRNSELSWTKRYKNASEILQIGQEILVEILSISEEKETAALSLRKTLPNPWNEIAEKLKVNTEIQGKVLQVMPQGALINVMEDVDGFMPRSKMRPIMKGKNRIPLKSSDELTVIVADINPETNTLILAPKESDEAPVAKKPTYEKRQFDKPKETNSSSTFSLGDMLSDSEKAKLTGMNS